MQRLIVRLVVPAALLTGASLALAFSSGPPASRTGAPAIGGVVAEGVCTACHTTFPLNTPGATVEILDVPQFYVPNTVYALRVRMTSTFASPRRWGFQITAVRSADGQGVGTFDIAGSTLMQILNGASPYATRRYVEHTSAGTFANNNGPVEWSFNWQAPASDLGRIMFFAAGNAANNSGTNSGDHIYTTSATTDPDPRLDVMPPLARNWLAGAYPNPFRGHTMVDYALATPGDVDLAVFDSQGRRVRGLVAGARPAGAATVAWDGNRDDGTAAGAGIYFVRLVLPERSLGFTRRVTLVR